LLKQAAHDFTGIIVAEGKNGAVTIDDDPTTTVIDLYRLDFTIDTHRSSIFPIVFGTAFNPADAYVLP
jgi:hypothetical protein